MLAQLFKVIPRSYLDASHIEVVGRVVQGKGHDYRKGILRDIAVAVHQRDVALKLGESRLVW